jgi:hypothetical protein
MQNLSYIRAAPAAAHHGDPHRLGFGLSTHLRRSGRHGNCGGALQELAAAGFEFALAEFHEQGLPH